MVHKNEFNFVLWLSSNLSTWIFDSRDLSTYGFHRFLWNMANFWIFSNHNYQQVDEVEKRVEENTHWSKGILSDINKNLKKRDDLRVQLEKMKIYNEQKMKDIEGEWLHFKFVVVLEQCLFWLLFSFGNGVEPGQEWLRIDHRNSSRRQRKVRKFTLKVFFWQRPNLFSATNSFLPGYD